MDSPLPDREWEENSEQADSGAQAQDVADEAVTRSIDLSEDSERGGRPNPAQIIPDDTEDLVERMEAMNRSGRIDMGAFSGEPQMDDEEDILGATEDVDDEDDADELLEEDADVDDDEIDDDDILEDEEDDFDDDVLTNGDDVEDQNDLA